MPLDNNVTFFTGTSNPELALKIIKQLPLPAELGKMSLSKFSDGELSCKIEENVRGSNAYIIQSTCAPANDSIMEIMVIADALFRASVNSITLVVPYWGYARQDRRPHRERTAISSKMVATMMASIPCITQIIIMDIHSDQQGGFFVWPMIDVHATTIFVDDIKRRYSLAEQKKITFVSPDIGGVVRNRKAAKKLNAELAIIDKRRPKENVAEVMNIIGDIDGRHCVLLDDMIDTAGTASKAAAALKQAGALSVVMYATHPVLSGSGYETIDQSGMDKLIVTDTIPLRPDRICDKIEVLSVAELMAKTISRILLNGSVGELDES